jgi:hypothetical protein
LEAAEKAAELRKSFFERMGIADLIRAAKSPQ